MKIIKFVVARSTNPNTGEEVLKLRALTDHSDAKYADILVFKPKASYEELEAEMQKDLHAFAKSLNLVETDYGPVLMVGSRREIIREYVL